MHYAEIETRNYTFTVFGHSEEHCEEVFVEAWQKHCEQKDIKFDSQFVAELWNEAGVHEVEPGIVLRDGQTILEPSSQSTSMDM